MRWTRFPVTVEAITIANMPTKKVQKPQSGLAYRLSGEDQDWLDMRPVGREFGSPEYERLADALTKLQSSQLMELEALELEHRVDIFLNVAHGQADAVFRPLNKLSTGQQCTAILHMLLLENVDPLLMDQPEDNLDNAFIADRIVAELREAKTSRQFLFATHNANIPVFGDAEWIGVFTAAENQGRLGLEAQGSIDVPVIRDQVASILEGGRDAFIQRKEKYEF